VGTPDHDDFITVQQKIIDLQNKTDQFVNNSKIFIEIKTLSDEF